MTVLMAFYLMCPPRTLMSREKGTWEVEGRAPLHMWVTIRTYDTAAECEADAKVIEQQMRTGHGDWKAVNQQQLKFSLDDIQLHQCVDSGDPRLR